MIVDEPGRSSGLGFYLPIRQLADSGLKNLTPLSPYFGGVGEAFTATGIAPELNGIPF